MNLRDFEDHLVWAEGERLDMYKDSVDIWTIGVGHNIQERGISPAVSRFILREDIQSVVNEVRELDYWHTLDSVRQLVIADMVFNLGLSRFLNFKNLQASLAIGDWQTSAFNMKDSKWYRQVGRRAEKLVEAMITGDW